MSRELAPIAVEQGATVVDKSAAFRMDPDVPLVVPEVNGDDIEQHRGIVSVPNCSTTPLVMALKPLHDVNPVVRVVADTYQSVSGTGQAAMEELRTQTPRVLNGQAPVPSAYPHQIAFNALPHIESFDENGYTREELKMLYETRKILHAPDLRVSATCVRVPVMVSHSEAVHVEFTHPISPDEVRDILSGVPRNSRRGRPGGRGLPDARGRGGPGRGVRRKGPGGTCPIPTASQCGSCRTTSGRARR